METATTVSSWSCLRASPPDQFILTSEPGAASREALGAILDGISAPLLDCRTKVPDGLSASLFLKVRGEEAEAVTSPGMDSLSVPLKLWPIGLLCLPGRWLLLGEEADAEVEILLPSIHCLGLSFFAWESTKVMVRDTPKGNTNRNFGTCLKMS